MPSDQNFNFRQLPRYVRALRQHQSVRLIPSSPNPFPHRPSPPSLHPGDTHHDVTVNQGPPPPVPSSGIPPPSPLLSRAVLSLPSVSFSLVGNNKWTDSIRSRTPSLTPALWPLACTKITRLYFRNKKAFVLRTKPFYQFFLFHCKSEPCHRRRSFTSKLDISFWPG